ncbi:MAG: hypothetical protein SFY69_02060 [Planctomycetota bacterium]|nr:hypothetical protein [Planctomycetota bacterium]
MIIDRRLVSKPGAQLEVYTLVLSDEWKKRLTIRRKPGFWSFLRPRQAF